MVVVFPIIFFFITLIDKKWQSKITKPSLRRFFIKQYCSRQFQHLCFLYKNNWLKHLQLHFNLLFLYQIEPLEIWPLQFCLQILAIECQRFIFLEILMHITYYDTSKSLHTAVSRQDFLYLFFHLPLCTWNCFSILQRTPQLQAFSSVLTSQFFIVQRWWVLFLLR